MNLQKSLCLELTTMGRMTLHDTELKVKLLLKWKFITSLIESTITSRQSVYLPKCRWITCNFVRWILYIALYTKNIKLSWQMHPIACNHACSDILIALSCTLPACCTLLSKTYSQDTPTYTSDYASQCTSLFLWGKLQSILSSMLQMILVGTLVTSMTLCFLPISEG